MASTKKYLDFVLEQLSELDEVSSRAMIRKPADISRQSRSMYVGRRMCARASTAPALRLIAQNSSVCPIEAQAAVLALRREKVVSVMEGIDSPPCHFVFLMFATPS